MMSTARRLCLITPGHLATNPRLVKEADALTAAGFEVTVVSSRFIAWADDADREFSTRPWRVVKTAFGPLAGRWRHVTQAVVQRLCRFWFVCTGLAAGPAYHPVVPALTRAARRVPADLYIAHNLAALPAAAEAARRHGGKLGFDAEDFHRGMFAHEVPLKAIERRLVAALEEQFLPRCEHLTAASPGIAAAYAQALGLRLPTVVLNVFPLREAPTEPVRQPLPTVYWFSQTLGPDRGLEQAIAGIALSQAKPRLVLRGTVSEAYRRQLLALARDQGLTDGVQFEPPAPPAEMLRLASGHAVGLASEQVDTVNRDICLTNKIFSYLLAGLPVLATTTQGQRALAADCQGAIFLYEPDDATQLARHIDALFGDAATLTAARNEAWRLGRARYHWEHEQARLLECVSDSLEHEA